MNIRLETAESATVVVTEGRLDFGAAADFQKQLEHAIAGAAKAGSAVVVDCAALDYVSSAGLRVFLIGAREAQRGGLSFSLCALRPAVREVLELSGFTQILAIHADRATALAQATRKPQ